MTMTLPSAWREVPAPAGRHAALAPPTRAHADGLCDVVRDTEPPGVNRHLQARLDAHP